MKIAIGKNDLTSLMDGELQLAIHAGQGERVEVYLRDGISKPDRHFLIGMVQLASVAVEETDKEFVSFIQDLPISLLRNGQETPIGNGLFIFKTEEGRISCISALDPKSSTKVVREALRQLTGTIRLDVP